MAQNSNGSLRIVGSSGAVINQAGYIQLADDFIALNEAGLADIENSNEAAVTFLTKNGSRRVIDKLNRDIKKETNKIKFMRDKDVDEDGKTRTHVSIPSADLTSVSQLAYLDDYIGIIKTLTGDDARRFLFALMMITKCR